jgi:hypothetical protein
MTGTFILRRSGAKSEMGGKRTLGEATFSAFTPAWRQGDTDQADAEGESVSGEGSEVHLYRLETRSCLPQVSMEKPQLPRHLAASGIRNPSVLGKPKCRPTWVIGPLGESLTMESLPAPGTARWVPRRKAQVVYAIAGGLLTFDDACARYGLTFDELLGWQRAVHVAGLAGLRVTQTQHYRAVHARRQDA